MSLCGSSKLKIQSWKSRKDVREAVIATSVLVTQDEPLKPPRLTVG